MIKFKSLKIHSDILKTIEKLGYLTPTPIQKEAIPHLLAGTDLLGIAQTGTGKTAAFLLPLITLFLHNKIKIKPARVRALILTPTRELASQIESNVIKYSKGKKISSKAIYGGVGYRPQILALSKGLDVLIATPGRLIDLVNDGHVLFEQLEVIVLDEADKMLDMGFIDDVESIIEKLPTKRQTLLFSATMPTSIVKLSESILTDAKRVEVAPSSTPVESIVQKVNVLERSNKPLLLKSILEDKKILSALVFTRTKHGADRVVRHLINASIRTAAIHGNKSQGARDHALRDFKAGRVRVLVATDIAARGIDIPDVDYVINYNLPDDPKSYIHRIGRTARAGKKGVAISFCEAGEMKQLKEIENEIQCELIIDKSHPFHGVPPNFSKQKPEKKAQHHKSKKRRTP